jgi:hypothetical protein
MAKSNQDKNLKTVVIFIALKEEFDVFLNRFTSKFNICSNRKDCLELYSNTNGNNNRFILYCMRDMASIHSYTATKSLITDFSPDLYQHWNRRILIR